METLLEMEKVGMTVRYSSFGYLIKEGFRSVFKQKKMTSASIIIMCATMFMFGIFFLIGKNVNYTVKQVESQQGMRVIIKDGATDTDISNLQVKLKEIDGVNTVTFYSKEDALATIKNSFGDHQELLSAYTEDNPFPASFFVTLTDLNKNKEVQDKIMKLDNVEEISTRNDTISNLSKIAQSIQTITLVLLLLLIIISIFIISYTIKLTVYARRKEISIMKYVGATNGFIRWPFIVEGMIIGILASGISIVIVGLAYNFLAEKLVNSEFMQVIHMSLISFGDMFNSIIFVYMLLGIGIGVLRKCNLNEKIFKSIKEKKCVNY